MEKKAQFTDTTTRQYQNSNYQKTEQGWVKQAKAKEQPASNGGGQQEYSDEQLAEYARKASDEALRKAGAGASERMRIAAKREILRRKNEGMPEPEKTDNPFDEGLAKGLFDEFPTKTVLGKGYINKGQGWEILEKGKKAEIGEIRTWSGEKYQRTETGWKYLGKANEKSNSKEDDSETPKVNTKAQDYNLEEVTIKEVARVSDKEAVKHLLNHWDKSGAMADAIKSGEADSYKYIVGVETKYGSAAYVWADEGVHYPSKTPEKSGYDKPWPQSVDKMTNRASDYEIFEAAKAAAKLKFEEKYPDKEDFFKKEIEDSGKYSWMTKYSELPDAEKAMWKDSKLSVWLQKEARTILGFGPRGEKPSKTTQIANIKTAYWGVAKRKEAAAKEKSYAEYLASDTGKARVAEVSAKIKEAITNYRQKVEVTKSELQGIFLQTEIVGLSTEDKERLQWNVHSESLSARGLGTSGWDSLEISYRQGWGGDTTRKYEVRISGDTLQPGDEDVKKAQLQLAFLTNTTLVDQAKHAMENIDEAQKSMREFKKQMKGEYSDLDVDSIVNSVSESMGE